MSSTKSLIKEIRGLKIVKDSCKCFNHENLLDDECRLEMLLHELFINGIISRRATVCICRFDKVQNRSTIPYCLDTGISGHSDLFICLPDSDECIKCICVECKTYATSGASIEDLISKRKIENYRNLCTRYRNTCRCSDYELILVVPKTLKIRSKGRNVYEELSKLGLRIVKV